MEVTIRRADRGEHAVLTELSFAAKRVWNYPEEYYDIWREELTITPEYIDGNTVLVAEADGIPAGYCAVTRVEQSFLAGEVLVERGHWLEHIFIHPAYQRQGIGRQLLAAVEAYALGAGVPSLKIFSDPNAAGFYKKWGAVYRGESPSSIAGRTTPLFEYHIQDGKERSTMFNLDEIRGKKGFICDMDGVIYHGNRLLDGVKEFVDWLKREDKRYLFLTNSSERSPLELQQKLLRLGLEVDESHFYTSALATAKFISSQSPGCSAYVIGAPGLLNALYDAGVTMNDSTPDYVVVGETQNYNYESISRAVRLVLGGAKLIGTNPDLTGPNEDGIAPACGSLVAPIERATGLTAYFVGKPNALMMRTGLRMLGVHSDEAAMIGDRMDTDIIAGIETGLDTVLVLSGVSTEESVREFPYRPRHILSGVGMIPDGR